MSDRLLLNSTSHNMNWCWPLGEDLILSDALLNQYHQPINYHPTLRCTWEELLHQSSPRRTISNLEK
jgi:hypothetical protein